MHFLPARLNRSGSKSVDTLASITSDSKASNGLLSPSSTQGVLSSDTSLASAPITTADEDSGLGRKIHPNPQSFIQNDGLPSPPSSPSRSRSPNGVVRSSSRPTLVASLSSNSNGTLQEEYLEGGFRPPSPKPRGLSPAPTPKKRASPPAPEMATIDSTAMKQTASAPLLGPSDWSTFGRVGITQRPSMEWATDVEMVPRPPGLFPPYSSPISDPIPSSPTFSESTVTQANLSTDIPPLASLSQSKNQYVTPPRKALSSAVRDSIDSIPSKSSPSSLETRGNRSSKSSPSSDSPQSNRSRHSLGTASGSALARLASLVGNGSPLASRRNSQDPSAASDLRPLTFGRSPERRNSLSATHVFSFVPPQPTKSNSASPDDARSIRTVTRRVSADLSAAEASAETSVSWQKGVTDEMIRLSIGRVPPPRSSIDAPDTTRPYRRSIRNSGLDEKAKAKDPSWFLDLDNPSSDVEQGIRPRKTSLPKKRTSRGKTRGQAHIKTASLPRNEAAKRDSLVFPTSKSGDVLKDTTKARANVVDPALPQEVRVQMMTSSTSAPLEKGNGNDKEPPPSDKGKDVSENIPPARTQPAPPSNVLVPPTLNFTAATPETSPLVLSNSPVTPRSHSTPTVFPSVEASSSTTPVEKRRSRRTTSGDYVDEPLSGGSLRTKRKSQDADDEHLPRIVDSAKRSNTMKSILRTPRVSAGADDVLGDLPAPRQSKRIKLSLSAPTEFGRKSESNTINGGDSRPSNGGDEKEKEKMEMSPDSMDKDSIRKSTRTPSITSRRSITRPPSLSSQSQPPAYDRRSSIPLRAYISARPSSLAPSRANSIYRMREAPKQSQVSVGERIERSSDLYFASTPRPPLRRRLAPQAWCFLGGFLFPFLWLGGSFLRVRSVPAHGKYAAEDNYQQILDPEELTWRFRCRLMACFALLVYIPVIVLAAVFGSR